MFVGISIFQLPFGNSITLPRLPLTGLLRPEYQIAVYWQLMISLSIPFKCEPLSSLENWFPSSVCLSWHLWFQGVLADCLILIGIQKFSVKFFRVLAIYRRGDFGDRLPFLANFLFILINWWYILLEKESLFQLIEAFLEQISIKSLIFHFKFSNTTASARILL